MTVLREKGYKYRGYRLGQKIKCKDDGKEYTIIGFDETVGITDGVCFIAIDKRRIGFNIERSEYVTSYIKTTLNDFEWVREDVIEKI